MRISVWGQRRREQNFKASFGSRAGLAQGRDSSHGDFSGRSVPRPAFPHALLICLETWQIGRRLWRRVGHNSRASVVVSRRTGKPRPDGRDGEVLPQEMAWVGSVTPFACTSKRQTNLTQGYIPCGGPARGKGQDNPMDQVFQRKPKLLKGSG